MPTYIAPSFLPLFDGDPVAGLKVKLMKTAYKVGKALIVAVVAEVADKVASLKVCD